MNKTIPNKRIIISRPGGPEVLQLIEEDLPPPGSGEVRLKVLISGVAFGDTLKRRGLLPGMAKIPYTPGYDLVGQDESGQRFAAFVGNGAHTQHANIPKEYLVPVPAEVSTEAAACLPLNYVTAWQMLHRVAKVDRGETVLIHGAAGGVGTALLELGRLHGLKVYGTASARKHETVSSLGGIPIDYRTHDFVKEILKHEPLGIDAVFDPIGGAHLSRSHQVLNAKGRLVAYGASSADSKLEMAGLLLRLAGMKLMAWRKMARFYGIAGTPPSTRKTIREDLGTLMELLRQRSLHPVIGARFPLEEARVAHELMEAQMRATAQVPVIGKILLIHFPS